MSKTVSVVSMIAMVSVLWWHSTSGSVVEEYFVPLVCTWAVPWFFVASGVFFWESINRKGAWLFLKGKIASLVIPYCLWALLGFVLSVGVMSEVSINTVLGIREAPAWNRALWYLRALIIFNIIGAPLWALCSRLRACGLAIFIILFMGISLAVHHYVLHIYGPNSSPVYFAIGVLISKSLLSGWKVDRRILCLSVSSLVCALICRGVWFGLGYRLSVMGGTLIANCSTVFLIVTIVSVVRYYIQPVSSSRFVMNVSSLTAIIYFMHVPLNSFFRSLICDVDSDYLFIIWVVCSPIMYITIAVVLKKFVYRVYCVLSGGR